MKEEKANPAEIPPELIASEPLSIEDSDLEQMEGSLGANPKWQSLLRILAEEYFKRGYFKRAHFAYDKLSSCEPADSSDLVGLARCCILLGERTKAVDSLLRILELYDSDEETRDWARAKIKILVKTAAPPPMEEAVQGPSKAPEAPSLRGKEGEAEQIEERERERLGPVDEKTAKVIRSLEDLGVVTSHSVPNHEQIASAKAKLEEDPDNPMILDWYAFLLYTARHIPEAIEVYEKLLEDNEPSPSALYYLGNAYLKISNLNKAFACWNRLKSLDPNSPLVKKVGRSIKRLNELKKKAQSKDDAPETGDSSGLKEVEETLEKSPNDPEVLDWAAFAYYTAGYLEKALAHYQRALLLDGDNTQALYYIGTIQCRFGEFDEAVKTWSRLIEEFPDDPLSKKIKGKYELLAASRK